MSLPGVTLSGKIQSITGANDAGTVTITLQNYGGNPPLVSGSSQVAVVATVVQAAADGTWSTTLWGNDQLSPSNTYYTVIVTTSNQVKVWSAAYVINSGTYDISNLQPLLSVTPTPTPSGAIVNNPTGPQQISNYSLTAPDLVAGNSITAPLASIGKMANVVYAHLQPGADFSLQLQNAIAALPATGGTIDARGYSGIVISSVDPFANIQGSQIPVTILLGAYQVDIFTTWNVTTGSRIIGQGGQIPEGTSQPMTGTILRCRSTITASPILKFFGVTGTLLDGVSLNGNNAVGAIGIYIDSVQNPMGSHMTFQRFSIRGCEVGVIWGDPGTTPRNPANNPTTDYACDHVEFDSFFIAGASNSTTSEGFHINGSNTTDASYIRRGAFETLNRGINIISGGGPYWSIENCSSADGVGYLPEFITIGAGCYFDPNIINCHCEGISAARGTAVRTGNTVTSVTVDFGGFLYGARVPTVEFVGGGGTGAAGTAVMAAGRVVSVTMTNVGSGYTSTPAVYFTSLGQTGGNVITYTAYAVHNSHSSASTLTVARMESCAWNIPVLYDGSAKLYSVANVGVGPDNLWVCGGNTTIVSINDIYYSLGINPNSSPWNTTGSGVVQVWSYDGTLSTSGEVNAAGLNVTGSSNQVAAATSNLDLDAASTFSVRVNRTSGTGGFQVFKGGTATKNFFVPDTGAATILNGLTPVTAGAAALGALLLPFSSIYIGGSATNNIQLTGVGTGSRLLTLPDTTDTLVAKATTDSFKNKTLVLAGSGNNVVLANNAEGAHQGPLTAVTGSAADVAMYTATIPANTLQAGKGLRIKWAYTKASGTNALTVKVKVDATIIATISHGTGNASGYGTTEIWNNAGSQVAQNTNTQSVVSTTPGALVQSTQAFDFTAQRVITLTQNVASPDTVTPVYFTVEVIQ